MWCRFKWLLLVGCKSFGKYNYIWYGQWAEISACLIILKSQDNKGGVWTSGKATERLMGKGGKNWTNYIYDIIVHKYCLALSKIADFMRFCSASALSFGKSKYIYLLLGHNF